MWAAGGDKQTKHNHATHEFIRVSTSGNNDEHDRRAFRQSKKSITRVNRSGWTDSKLSLDAGGLTRESANMIAQPYRLYIERKDPAKNMARFYMLSIEATLFGEVCLVRQWGRIGARGQRMEHSFPREEEAVSLLLDLLRQKRQRGYRPRGN